MLHDFSWLHAHQRNPTALYHIGLPYAFDSPGRVSAFAATDKQFAGTILLPLDASSLSVLHGASWQAALNKEHGVFDCHGVCDIFARSLVPDGNRILRMKCVWKVKCSQEGLAARFKARWVVCGQHMIKGVHFFSRGLPLPAPRLSIFSAALQASLVSVLFLSTWFPPWYQTPWGHFCISRERIHAPR